MRVLLKIHDRNEPEKWTHLELAFDMNQIDSIQSIELTVSHKLGEEPELCEETQFNKNTMAQEIVKRTKRQGQLQQIKYYSKERVPRTKYEENLAQAKTYHTHEINFMDPIMNFSKPFQTGETSILDDDNSTTGPKNSRRTSVTSFNKSKAVKGIFKESPGVYRIKTGVRNSNCFGRRSFPYKLYPQSKSSSRLNRYQNKIIPADVMKEEDPILYEEICDRIKQEGVGETEITESLWNKVADQIGREKEGSTDESSRSHSITLVRSANRSTGQSPRSPMSESPKSPMKDEAQYDTPESPREHDWNITEMSNFD